MVCVEVALCLHKESFDLPLSVVVWGPLAQIPVCQYVSKFIQGQVLHLVAVPGKPVYLLGGHDVVVVSVVSRGSVLHSLSHHVAVEFKQQSDQTQVPWGNLCLQVGIVPISERIVA